MNTTTVPRHRKRPYGSKNKSKIGSTDWPIWVVDEAAYLPKEVFDRILEITRVNGARIYGR